MGLFRFGFCAGILHFHDQPSGIIAVAAKDGGGGGKGKGNGRRREERGTEEGNTKRGRNSEGSRFRVWNFSVPRDEVLMLMHYYLPGSRSVIVLGFEMFYTAQPGPISGMA